MIYLILIVGVILRLINLNQSLWLDEAITALAIKNNSLSNLTFSFMRGDVHPPLHYLLLWFWGKVFGYSEVSLRMPSVLLGVLTIYLVNQLGKSLFNKKIGLVSALIFCFNPLVIYYSQEARMYSLNVFLTCLSFLTYILFLKKKKYSFLGLTLTNLLLLYSDYILFPVLIVQLAYIYFYSRDKIFIFINSLFLSLLGFLGWLPIFLTQLGLGKESTGTLGKWGEVVGGLNVKNLILVFVKMILGRISFDNKLIYGILASGSFGLYFGLVFLGIKKLQKEKVLILTWLFAPIVLIALVSLYLPVLSYHRLVFVAPALAILMACGVFKLVKKIQVLTLALILLISSLSLFLYYNDPRFQREDWRGAVKFAEDKSPRLILFEDNNLIAPVEYYKTNTLNLQPGLKKIPAASGSDILDLSRILRNGLDVYVVEYLVEITDPKRLLIKNLEDLGYKSHQVYNFNSVGFITLYTRSR